MLKKMIKRLIGKDKINIIKAYKKYICSLYYSAKKEDRFQILDSSVEKTYVIENPKGHIFCGYFDVKPNNPYNENEILVGMLNKNAKMGKDSMEIAIADYINNKIRLVTSTRAWNWQMGSRLRWSKRKNVILYNDYYKDKYCCVAYDILQRKVIKRIPYALYDISDSEKIGLTINFSRLQRLRAGYGYNNIDDFTKEENASGEDGLFLVNLDSEEKSLLISYKKLSSMMPESINKQCYINHISFSPDEKKAMFFFIWKIEEKPGWKATLWVIDIETRIAKCLEKVDQVSHYDWKDNNTLLITGSKNNTRTGFYREYNCLNGTYVEICNENLHKDGHPVYSREFHGFYSDTYPDKKCRQTLFKYDFEKYIPLLRVYHDPRMFGEKRCDLHPHYFSNTEMIAIDTTYDKNKRKIILIRMREKDE